MNRNTRRMLLNIATGVAVAATAAVVFLPAAYAQPGTITTNVNVRSGPGTNYGVVDTVRRGTPVDVRQCQGSWCYIDKLALTAGSRRAMSPRAAALPILANPASRSASALAASISASAIRSHPLCVRRSLRRPIAKSASMRAHAPAWRKHLP